MSFYDVVVVGGGNAGLSAALAACYEGGRVLVADRAPRPKRGGNSVFTAGAMRFAYRSQEDIRELVPDLSESQLAKTDFGSYPEDAFFDDMARVTDYRTDPDLAEVLVRDSRPAMRWLQENGVSFLPIYGRQAYEVDGQFKFWGGLTLETNGGGPGLVESLERACDRAGGKVEYGVRARELVVDRRGVVGIRVERDGEVELIDCGAVVLAAGGFQSNAEWRTRYLGPGWDLAKVRGTQFNTGDGIRMALDVGASSCGNWSGCHSVAWDLNAPEFGDRSIGDAFQKHSYPLGLMVNNLGERFVDEGADFRNYTYAKYGAEILKQRGQMAWQLFDAKVADLLRDEYRIREVTKVSADTVEDLAKRMETVDTDQMVRTIEQYNAAVRDDAAFNPNIKDGRHTEGLSINKSNWAQRLDTPPFEAYAVTCGITFTFGGLRISTDAEVIDEAGSSIPGLYAAGELVGGLFYFNYPGGSGLTSGTVFGRRAGAGAARQARDR